MPGRPPPFTVMLHTWREHGKPRPWDKNDPGESMSTVTTDASSVASVDAAGANGAAGSVPSSPRMSSSRHPNHSLPHAHGATYAHGHSHHRMRSTPSLESLAVFVDGAQPPSPHLGERERTQSRQRFHMSTTTPGYGTSPRTKLVSSRSSNSLDETPQRSAYFQRYGPQRVLSHESLGDKQKQVLSIDSNLSRLCHSQFAHHEASQTGHGADPTGAQHCPDSISKIIRSPCLIVSRAVVASTVVHADTFEDDSGDDFGTGASPTFSSTILNRNQD
ncbi:hypothetical protein FVE85_0837 [Porphyridium purpureum]|uniref:Uncharacterized protein n=1 Tax=Porphyridium purpureum TaxID=35688 RepID=A0A5J4Z1A2_PORPP|nr:hypothetical protein FVE85_0837 [Porphyridium purpureum]|eukprot:POR2905..scf208_2